MKSPSISEDPNAAGSLAITKHVVPAANAIYLRDGRYDGMTRKDVADAFAAFAASGKERVALFFHGGLVSKQSGIEGAGAQYALYKDICYPYFFIWESGFAEVLAHHLPAIFLDTLFRSVLGNARLTIARALNVPTPLALQLESIAPEEQNVLDAAALDAARRETFAVTATEMDEFVQGVVSDPAVRGIVADIARRGIAAPSSPPEKLLAALPSIKRGDNHYLNESTTSSIVSSYWSVATVPANATSIQLMALPIDEMAVSNAVSAFAHAAVSIFLNIAKRIRAGRDHGLQCTIVEEILRTLYLARFGSGVWEEMKKETEEAFGADSTQFGGTAVIEELCDVLKRRPNVKVTLIGHSTGGVYIGNFLRHVDAALRARGNTDFSFDVVHMAAANTVRFWDANYTARIQALRCFSMADLAEQNDLLMSSDLGTDPNPSILGRVYPRSLLYLISGVLETFAPGVVPNPPHDLDTTDMPVFGMDRFFEDTTLYFARGSIPRLAIARKCFAGLGATNAFLRVLSPTASGAPDGQRCTAMKHGAFPSDPSMCESLAFCLQGGIR